MPKSAAKHADPTAVAAPAVVLPTSVHDRQPTPQATLHLVSQLYDLAAENYSAPNCPA